MYGFIFLSIYLSIYLFIYLSVLISMCVIYSLQARMLVQFPNKFVSPQFNLCQMRPCCEVKPMPHRQALLALVLGCSDKVSEKWPLYDMGVLVKYQVLFGNLTSPLWLKGKSLIEKINAAKHYHIMFNKSSIQILQMGQTWPNPHISALLSHFCILIFRRISTIYPDCWRSRLPRNSRIRRTGALIISSVQCQRGFPQKSDRCILFNTGSLLFGGLEHCFHILGIIIPNDFHIFQRRWNHQPNYFARSSKCFPTIWDFVGFITSDFRSIITWKLNWQELGFVSQK